MSEKKEATTKDEAKKEDTPMSETRLAVDRLVIKLVVINLKKKAIELHTLIEEIDADDDYVLKAPEHYTDSQVSAIFPVIRSIKKAIDELTSSDEHESVEDIAIFLLKEICK